jgi:hypothetical protein
METEVVGSLFHYNTLIDFVSNHRDLLTHAYSVSAVTHEGKISSDYIDRETEGDMPLSIITKEQKFIRKKAEHKQIMLVFTQPVEHVLLKLKYVHPDIRDLFERECPPVEHTKLG